MTLIDFIKEYPDELSCKAKFKQYWEQVGVICPKCGSEAHYWKRDKESYECKQCNHRQSLKANTVMHKSKLPSRWNLGY
jgi:DNA-directed RNA polymerase subunit RPC12/RpoP